MSEVMVVLSTIDDRARGEEIARCLVSERLAACVNIIPGVLSVYRWKGNLEESRELLMVIKTTASRLEPLKRRLTDLHSYEVPELIAFPIHEGHSPYLEWVASSVRGETDSS